MILRKDSSPIKADKNTKLFSQTMFPIDNIRQLFQTQISSKRFHFFEICDLAITPSFIKHCCQSTLTAQWTHRLPFLQSQSPADLASTLLQSFLSTFPDINSERYYMIEFCSGAGGPTPNIEKSLNNTRTLQGNPPLPFRLSDLHPNIDAWMPLASHSANLSFIPQPIDATEPSTSPSLIISKTSSVPNSSIHKTIHMYNLSFHHFDDEAAQRVIDGVLATADGIVIMELQDRSLGMLLLMSLEFFLLFLTTIFWFWGEWVHLFFTYFVPILPFVQAWDGMVSCLRTRTFEEVLRLVEKGVGEKAKVVELGGSGIGERWVEVEVGEWVFRGERKLHTWPFGYVNAVVGRKIDKSER